MSEQNIAIDISKDTGDGLNRITINKDGEFLCGDTGERNNTVEEYATTLKALYFAVEHIADLQQQLNEQKAHVEMLAEICEELRKTTRFGREVNYTLLCDELTKALGVIHQTPKQSLASYEAKVIDKAVAHVAPTNVNVKTRFKAYTDQLREQAEGG